MTNLTYQEIDQLEINLSNPKVQNLHYYNEYIIRLLTQTLRNNRFLADKIQCSVTESRMAFNTVNELETKMEKMESNMKFLLGNSFHFKNDNDRIKGIKID